MGEGASKPGSVAMGTLVYMYVYGSAGGELVMSPAEKLMAHVAQFRLHCSL